MFALAVIGEQETMVELYISLCPPCQGDKRKHVHLVLQHPLNYRVLYKADDEEEGKEGGNLVCM